MKTAILISGQARTIAKCLPTQHWHVYRHFEDLHFFIVWQDEPNAVAGVKLLEDKYGKERVHAKLITDPTDLPMIPLKDGAHAPYANAAPHPQLMMQHLYQEEVWKFYKEHNGDAETVIRMRGDNFFHSFAMPREKFGDIVETSGNVVTMSTSKERQENTAYLPWWGRFGGVNDRFAIMGPRAAEHYFTVFSKIERLMKELNCPFHPESLLMASLEDGGVIIDESLRAEFSTQRLDGKVRLYLGEVLPPDMANLLAH